MTDLHTHILPGMDDGARTADESLELLRMERDQGVDTVVLTSHFYRDREEPRRFLQRRQAAVERLTARLDSLPQEERETLPRLVLGAEVAWWPNLADCEELPELCIGNTRNLLLELPFTPWNDRVLHQTYDLFGHTGITPVIAHLDRYLKIQKKERIQEVLSLGVPVQVGTDILLAPLHRRRALKLLRGGWVHSIASDCHNREHRPPQLARAAEMLERKLGREWAVEILNRADELAGTTYC